MARQTSFFGEIQQTPDPTRGHVLVHVNGMKQPKITLAADHGPTQAANPTSAESYDASQYELIAEAEGVNDDLDRPLARAVRRGLQIQNGLAEQPAQWSTIHPKFRNPRFESRAQAADAGAKQLAAVPWLAETEVGLELLGLTDSQIKRAMAEQRRVAGRRVLDALAPATNADA